MTLDDATTLGMQELREIAAYDWIQVGDLARIAGHVGGASTPGDVRECSLAIIERALRCGIARAGQVSAQGFQPFDEPWVVTLEHARHLWPLDRAPEPGEILWLDVDRFWILPSGG